MEYTLFILAIVCTIAAPRVTQFQKLSEIPELQSLNGYSLDDLSHCKYIFLDVGSNRAMHIKFLFHEEMYPKSVYPKNIFHNYFPTRTGTAVTKRIFSSNSQIEIQKNTTLSASRKDICAFGFEPNPDQASNLKEVEKKLNEEGHYVRIFNIGLSNYTGVV